MDGVEVCIRFAGSEADVHAAHDLFLRRIGGCLVEDGASFRSSACAETADWIPRLALAFVPGGRWESDAPHRPDVGHTDRGPDTADPAPGTRSRTLAGAQLGGLLPAVGMVSLPYTAVAEPYEGRGVYLQLKRVMLAELAAVAHARGLPPPLGNVSEEAPGSAQYRRKVGRGIATPFPFWYAQPAVQGLEETPLVLTCEALVSPPPTFTPDDRIRIVAAIYRGLYRIAEPELNPTFRRIAASVYDRSHVGPEPSHTSC